MRRRTFVTMLKKQDVVLLNSDRKKDAAERQIQEIDLRLAEIQEIREWDEERKRAMSEMKKYEQDMDRTATGNKGGIEPWFFSFCQWRGRQSAFGP